MQKLQEKLKNAPWDAPLVPSPASVALNREETLSVRSKVRACNNLEVARPQHREGPKAAVYVLNRNGKALMPCNATKAKHLIKGGKAKVIRRIPFTVRLNWDCEENVQEVSLGIDSGAKKIGFSAVSEEKELISGEIELDTNMKSRLDDRRMYRRNRRSRKWYRKPRFNNRRKKEDQLPPSIERKYQAHLKIINQIKKLLPVTKVTIETGNFDIQKIENPEITGTGYQQGDRYSYENMKAYILAREKGKCQFCGKEIKKQASHLHHIIARSKGGTDKADNLALLHKNCHDKLHKQKKEKQLKKNRQYKEAIFMSTIRWKFRQDLDCFLTYGYKTFCDRITLEMTKTHANDAFVIAGGTTNQKRTTPFQVIQKRKNNRCLQKNRKGFAPAIRKQRYNLQPMDLIKINGKIQTVKGTHCNGKNIMITETDKSIAVKKLENWILKQTTLKFITKEAGVSSPT